MRREKTTKIGVLFTTHRCGLLF